MADDDAALLAEDDPVLAEAVRKAVAPLEHLLPPEEIADCKETVSDALATHPTTADLVDRLRPRHVEESGDVAKEGDEADHAQSSELAAGRKR